MFNLQVVAAVRCARRRATGWPNILDGCSVSLVLGVKRLRKRWERIRVEEEKTTRMSLVSICLADRHEIRRNLRAGVKFACKAATSIVWIIRGSGDPLFPFRNRRLFFFCPLLAVAGSVTGLVSLVPSTFHSSLTFRHPSACRFAAPSRERMKCCVSQHTTIRGYDKGSKHILSAM